LIYWRAGERQSSRREFVGQALCRPYPRHEFVEPRRGPKIDELGQQISDVGLRIDAGEFAGLDQ
jgi:hypothetical protein